MLAERSGRRAVELVIEGPAAEQHSRGWRSRTPSAARGPWAGSTNAPDPPDRNRGTCGRRLALEGISRRRRGSRACEHEPTGTYLMEDSTLQAASRPSSTSCSAPARRCAYRQRPARSAERGREPVDESRRDPPAELTAARLASAVVLRGSLRREGAIKRSAASLPSARHRGPALVRRTSTTSRLVWTTPT